MDHNEAENSNMGIMHLNISAFEKFSSHYSNLSKRPDWKGYVTRKEGIAWAKSHPNLKAYASDNEYKNATPNDALYLDASKMDFGNLSADNFINGPGLVTEIGLLLKTNSNLRSISTTYALGRTKMILNSSAFGGMVTVVNGPWNNYDWDWGGGPLRSTLIGFERLVQGLNDTHGFPVNIYGVGFLKH